MCIHCRNTSTVLEMSMLTSAYCNARWRRSPLCAVRSVSSMAALLLTAGSLARECDRRKLLTPSECRKFGRAEWGTLYDYTKLASCARTCSASLWKNPRLTRAAKKRRTQNEKRWLERRPSRASMAVQPILHTHVSHL